MVNEIGQKDKQWSTKHYTENKELTSAHLQKGKIHMFQKSKSFPLH